ncbi:hypothetical protein BKA81DRAFT_126522 [Phyllosticta paracitricarpa]
MKSRALSVVFLHFAPIPFCRPPDLHDVTSHHVDSVDAGSDSKVLHPSRDGPRSLLWFLFSVVCWWVDGQKGERSFELIQKSRPDQRPIDHSLSTSFHRLRLRRWLWLWLLLLWCCLPVWLLGAVCLLRLNYFALGLGCFASLAYLKFCYFFSSNCQSIGPMNAMRWLAICSSI